MRVLIGYLPIVASVLALLVAFILANWIKNVNEGEERMKEIAGHIREGAMAFLAREYKTMVIVIVVLCAAIAVFINKTTAVLYVVGALFSVLAGFREEG